MDLLEVDQMLAAMAVIEAEIIKRAAAAAAQALQLALVEMHQETPAELAEHRAAVLVGPLELLVKMAQPLVVVVVAAAMLVAPRVLVAAAG